MAALETPINVSITNTAYTAVSLGATQRAKSIVAKTRGGTAWLVSDVAAGTTYFTVPANTSLAIEFNRTIHPGEVLFYAEDGTGAATIEVVIVK